MTLATWLTTSVLVVEYALKIYAIGTVPQNRRPSSSSAWLLLILFLPFVGFPLYWLIGSPFVSGRRHRIQQEANAEIHAYTEGIALLPDGLQVDQALTGVIRMNRNLTGLPCQAGVEGGLYADTAEFFDTVARAIDSAERYVLVEFYILIRDTSTEPVFAAMERAVARGVPVRVLLDQTGSHKYPTRKQTLTSMTAAGIEWHEMMPIDPLRGKWRRPDLRNHRKLVVVDGLVGFCGSHNLIEPSYGSARNRELGRAWVDLSMQVLGDPVGQLEAVFLTDWFTESGEHLDLHPVDELPVEIAGAGNAMQLVPSGPGFPSEPNLRMFTALIASAVHRVAITSPYFVPDDALLQVITSAALRGVEVELFVGEEADQFLVGHAQRSYYQVLLEAGVKIWLYPAPMVLHGKYLTVDDRVGVIGSSNMDFRSFSLNYEIMMLGFGGSLVQRLHENDERYRAVSRVLTLAEWNQRSWRSRYVDNVCRLTAALM